MNKKIFGGIAIVAIAVAVGFNVSISNQKQDKTSMLALANVEALAEPEVLPEVVVIGTNQKQSNVSMLEWANIQALAQTGGEFGGGSSSENGASSSWGSFTFDGNTYDCENHWYNVVGKHWCPDVRTCTNTEGVDCGYVNLDTYNGHKLVCTSGDGNCLQNSRCI